MKNVLKFSLILIILVIFNIAVVSASEINVTDDIINEIEDSQSINGNFQELNDDYQVLAENSQAGENSDILGENSGLNENVTAVDEGQASDESQNSVGDTVLASEDSQVLMDNKTKTTPTISVNSNKITTGNSVKISLLDSNGNAISNKNLTVKINDKTHVLLTNTKGIASLKLDLPAKSYNLKVTFSGSDEFNSVTKTFKITVKKLNSKITPVNPKVLSGYYFKTYLRDVKGNPISGYVSFSVNGKTYKVKTNSKGLASFKVKQKVARYSLKISYAGNSYYNSASKTIYLYVPAKTSLTIGNKILLSNGFLRIYLKSAKENTVSKKVINVNIGGKTFSKKTNSEGVAILKPKMGAGMNNITATYGGNGLLTVSKDNGVIKCIKGNVKDPLTKKVKLRNGVPNIDYMPGSYVMADSNAKYTLTKAQYKEVLKRDSYTLFLHKKISKYTFFKTKAEPKINHILVREKWNVIERTLNTRVVLKNSHSFWPSQLTVNLKGKSYTYPEVRDIQNTGYTCGPTSASMCTQVLRNYVNEAYLGYQAGSNAYSGSSTSGLKYALEKNHCKCSYYYKSSFSTALKELKKGGCALVFHTWNHYVAILDISKDGKKVLVGNPSGDYNSGSHSIPTNWLTVKHMYGRFNNYDTSGLIVKLKYSLSKSTKSKMNNLYSSFGAKWTRSNTNERLVDIGY